MILKNLGLKFVLKKWKVLSVLNFNAALENYCKKDKKFYFTEIKQNLLCAKRV